MPPESPEMRGEHSLSEITALDVIEHLNALLAFLMEENRELERAIAHRERKIELLLATDRPQGGEVAR